MSTGGSDEGDDETDCAMLINVGIISTPNQPTYRRLLVEVTQSQKLSQVEALVGGKELKFHCFEQKSKTIREMVELLFLSSPLEEDMKDVFIHPRGLGLRGVLYNVTELYVPCR